MPDRHGDDARVDIRIRLARLHDDPSQDSEDIACARAAAIESRDVLVRLRYARDGTDRHEEGAYLAGAGGDGIVGDDVKSIRKRSLDTSDHAGAELIEALGEIDRVGDLCRSRATVKFLDQNGRRVIVPIAELPPEASCEVGLYARKLSVADRMLLEKQQKVYERKIESGVEERAHLDRIDRLARLCEKSFRKDAHARVDMVAPTRAPHPLVERKHPIGMLSAELADTGGTIGAVGYEDLLDGSRSGTCDHGVGGDKI